MRRIRRGSLAVASGLVALAAACGGGGGSSAAPTPVTPPSGEGTDLVFISDSIGWNVASRYAQRAQQALGGTVRVTDWAIGSQSAVEALSRIKANPTIVANAEIIVVHAGGSAAGAAASEYQGICMVNDPTPRNPPHWFTVDDWKPYRDQLDAMYAEIWRLRNGAPTVMRAFDYYNPVISQWRLAGIEPECSGGLASMSAAMRQVAEANGATFLSLYDLFNGASHQDDPRNAGYIGSDGIHTTPDGADAIANALAKVGFAQNTMPGK